MLPETKLRSFNTDRKFEAKLEQNILRILANTFIKKDIQCDLAEGTDFLVYRINPFRVAVRIRRNKFFLNPIYREQFTIRWERPSGAITEINKIRNKLVDYLLYGFANQEENNIIHWFIGDLKIFNQHMVEPVEIKLNNPPDSKLAVYNIRQFPIGFIIKKYPSGSTH